MEPDFDSILSKKIRQTEQQHVTWNKKMVWRNLQSETDATRHYHYFYYADAAMILLLIYFAFGLIPNDIKPQVTDAKAKSGQEATRSERSVVPEENQDYALDPTVNHLENTATRPVAKIPNNLLETTKAIRHETKGVDAVTELALADIKIRAEEFLLPEVVTASEEEKIRPIVGVITESYPGNVANVKQKKSLRKLEPTVPGPWEDPRNALVFVVRK